MLGPSRRLCIPSHAHVPHHAVGGHTCLPLPAVCKRSVLAWQCTGGGAPLKLPHIQVAVASRSSDSRLHEMSQVTSAALPACGPAHPTEYLAAHPDIDHTLSFGCHMDKFSDNGITLEVKVRQRECSRSLCIDDSRCWSHLLGTCPRLGEGSVHGTCSPQLPLHPAALVETGPAC